MTGDYHVQKRLLLKAGAILAESFNQFNAVLKWMAAYPDLRALGKLAIVTNAGYETVGSVDFTNSARTTVLRSAKCSSVTTCKDSSRHPIRWT